MSTVTGVGTKTEACEETSARSYVTPCCSVSGGVLPPSGMPLAGVPGPAIGFHPAAAFDGSNRTRYSDPEIVCVVVSDAPGAAPNVTVADVCAVKYASGVTGAPTSDGARRAPWIAGADGGGLAENVIDSVAAVLAGGITIVDDIPPVIGENVSDVVEVVESVALADELEGGAGLGATVGVAVATGVGLGVAAVNGTPTAEELDPPPHPHANRKIAP
jgi:hypothetical protein